MKLFQVMGLSLGQESLNSFHCPLMPPKKMSTDAVIKAFDNEADQLDDFFC